MAYEGVVGGGSILREIFVVKVRIGFVYICMIWYDIQAEGNLYRQVMENSCSYQCGLCVYIYDFAMNAINKSKLRILVTMKLSVSSVIAHSQIRETL